MLLLPHFPLLSPEPQPFLSLKKVPSHVPNLSPLRFREGGVWGLRGQAPRNCTLKPRALLRLCPPLHLVYLTNLFLTWPTWSKKEPAVLFPRALPSEELCHPRASVSSTGRVWAARCQPAGLRAAQGFLGFPHSSSSPPRFGIGCVWPTLGKNGVMCAEMPRGQEHGRSGSQKISYLQKHI